MSRVRSFVTNDTPVEFLWWFLYNSKSAYARWPRHREGENMLGQLRKRLTYSNVVSTFTLLIVLGTGTAYATHLVVRSSDVVNESLVSADLKNGFGVVGADVTNNSLTGADVREGTLGQVPAATLGGLGRSAADSGCNPTTSAFVRCVEVALDLPSPARVLLNARITATKSQGTVGNAFGQCRWGGVVESGSL